MFTSRFLPLLAVLAVCGVLRVWVVCNSEVISRDGTVYVKMASRLPAEPKKVISDNDYHVGYPAAMVAAHGLGKALGIIDEGVSGWDLAGQSVSLAASLAAIVAIWLFAGMTFDWRIAWISALLFGLGRKWTGLGADVVSDSLAVCLQMWAVVVALLALSKLKSRSKWFVVLGGCVGILAGLGYLVRPEALLVVGLAGLLWMAYQFRRRVSWPLTACGVLAAVVCAIACALPYMIAIGGLSKKKSLADIVAMPAARDALMTATSALSSGEYFPVRQLVNKLFEALHPMAGFLVCIWLVCYIAKRLVRSRNIPIELPPVSRAGGFVMLTGLALITPMLMGLHANVGYLSYRHAMFLAALLSPLIGAGVIVLAGIVAQLLGRTRIGRPGRRAVLIVMVSVMAVSVGLHALRPLHRGNGHFRRAGELAGELIGPQGRILAESNYVLHYAQVEGLCLPEDMSESTLDQWVRMSKATHLVLSDNAAGAANDRISKELASGRFVEIGSTGQAKSGRSTVVRIFRIGSATSAPDG